MRIPCPSLKRRSPHTDPLTRLSTPRRPQEAATQEKFVLEEAQRAAAKERKATCTEWVPKFFAQVSIVSRLFVSSQSCRRLLFLVRRSSFRRHVVRRSTFVVPLSCHLSSVVPSSVVHRLSSVVKAARRRCDAKARWRGGGTRDLE